ncbi:ABC transporter substrate-binding protein [Lysinibacillus sp. NPDC096418]|uniref:ABC transporter substrate-binding protein n=1 Tax=Lysinibacillus sp. NPDC096418 TaxID=3364138 RepID=UPI0038238BBF
MKKGLLLFITVIVSALLLVACNQESTEKVNSKEDTNEEKNSNRTAYPLEIEIYDAQGNTYTQTFEKAPERIVTNNPSSIELLLELGLEDKIVGILNPDNEVKGKHAETIAKLHNLGDKKTVSRETVVGIEPDIVVGRSVMFNDENIGSIATLNQFEINVYSQSASHINQNPKLTSVIDDVLTLGKIFDVNDRAEEYAAELQARYDKIVKKIKENKTDEKLTILAMARFDTSAGTFSNFITSQGLQKDAIEVINLESAMEGSNGGLNYESLISTNPDVILYITADRNIEYDSKAIETLLSEPLIKDVSAISEGHIYETTYDDFMDYGVRIFDIVETLSNELYGK